MKTTTLFAVALLLNCHLLLGQSNISIGVIGGPTAANFRDGSPLIPKKWVTAFSIGSAIRVDLKKHIFFQTELSYERKGFSFGEIEITDFNAIPIGKKTFDEFFNYALVTPTIGFAADGKIHFEASFGFWGGYLVNLQSNTVVIPNDSIGNPRFLEAGDLNRLDFGATGRIGVGFDFAKKWSLKVNAIGNWGFAQPYSSIPNVAPGFGKDNTMSFGLQLGLFYKI
jgi:hypothetical protein